MGEKTCGVCLSKSGLFHQQNDFHLYPFPYKCHDSIFLLYGNVKFRRHMHCILSIIICWGTKPLVVSSLGAPSR